jgi:hypothetical protein
LISDEHSAKLAFPDDANTQNSDFDLDAGDDSDRLFDFEVRQTGQQDETAVATEGFKVRLLLRFIDKSFQYLEDIPRLHVRNQCPSSIVYRNFRHGASSTQGDCRGHEPGHSELGVHPREVQPQGNRGITFFGLP